MTVVSALLSFYNETTVPGQSHKSLCKGVGISELRCAVLHPTLSEDHETQQQCYICRDFTHGRFSV